MSLSRILNDEPPPPRTNHGPSRGPAIDVSLADMSPISNPATMSPTHSRTHHRSQSPGEQPPPPRGYTYQPVSYQGVGGWDPYSGKYVQGDIFPLGPGGNYYLQRERDAISSGPPEQLETSSSAYYKEGENEHASKKRRKAPEQDADYQPPTSKRPGLRRNPPRSKAARQGSYTADGPDASPAIAEYHQTEEERRLISSDLSDCEEVWIGELSDYILETHKRQRQVESWFEASVLERNSTTAVALSRHYVSRIAQIPPPPSPPPMPLLSVDEDLLSTLHPSPPPDAAIFDHAGDSTEYNREPRGRSFNAGAEDAARELEESLLGSWPKNKRKDPLKRPANGAVSDASSDLEIPTPAARREKPANKKRKVDKDASAIADEFERAVDEASASPVKGSKAKGKGMGAQLREQSVESTATSSLTPKGRKKAAAKKKLDGLHLDVSGRHATSAVVYELDEVVPPLKRAKKIDDNAMAKRVKSLEEAQKKVWTNIARRDIAEGIQARRPFVRTAKANKDVQAKAKRLMREMLVFWKKNEREERDVRKREQKEAVDRAKIEEEKREAARQARKLEFLISQTELYSHFVGNKLKTAEVQGETAGISAAPAGAYLADVDPTMLREIDFDDEDQTNLHRHARHNAQEAIALAKQRAQQFDTQAALDRKTNEALKLAKAQAHIRDDDESTSGLALMDLDSDELNFQNPTSLTGPLTIKQPRMLMAQLKEYQLKGLNWLGTLYEQGINGILADEMGLGKTVQSISLLAYLAEVHDIWGPFLVVAPASTLHNWQQEITRFVPSLKALPYWGNVKDRTTLRKFWSKKEISYDKDAPFHVLITSYQLVTQDQQYFQRVKWQYMVLDEAQNIKNASSNSMQELWALLHFIMPSLFDSHDEFNEWFSKDIENAAENKGSKLNEHQLRRLHMILKPFMLRRVKRHVQNELSEKIEIDIFAANIGDADSARSLMNLVMQFRKVCNHPELFERADVIAPFSFAHFGRSGPLNREGDLISVPYSTRNPIEYHVPELFHLEGGLIDLPSEIPGLRSPRLSAHNLFNIWSTDWIHKSMYDEIEGSPAFAFLRLLNKTPGEVHGLQVSSFMRNRLGWIGGSPLDQLPPSSMQIPEAKRLIHDSAKLARLDTLLQELKGQDHRVLIYFQMTRMMDLMEEYLIYRQYKYLRLDGSSKLEDRRDMVMDWQTRPDIFVFLLSTRAGGLGINLTAADTVIFYDHDWNPSNDAQAMDRAHRLGQTRQVTVYRLITKGTIDERIIQLARVKKDVQDIVVGNKNFTDVAKPSEIVQLLLNDEQLANLDNANAPGPSSRKAVEQLATDPGNTSGGAVRDLWNDEGDDFFGHTINAGNATVDKAEEEGASAPNRGKKRKAGTSGAARPRKTGGKAAGKKKVEDTNDTWIWSGR
ncbi:P-loop containing nucleoside triphosphate hydrolase protein [Melanogaster broomeanus]|nr:P-loop containing nucleoside triphosphate hydrolase protein [Melanogaster broomeanus]